MRIRHELTYAAPPSDVYEMRANPEFRARVCEAMDAVVRHAVTVDENSDPFTISVEMVQHTEAMPTFARKFAGDESRVIHTERWSTVDKGHIEVEAPGKPGSIRGTLSLTEVPDGSVYCFDGEAKANIPLIGGKLESLAHELFIEGMETEHQVATAWLDEARR